MSKKMAQPEEKVTSTVDLQDMPLNTIEDYRAYNKEARKQKRPIKVPPCELHKQVKIKFQRFDQPENVLKAYRRSAEIDWRGQLKPGGIYTLPLPVVTFLNSLSEPIYGEVDVNDGGVVKKETRQVGERARFSCQMLDVA